MCVLTNKKNLFKKGNMVNNNIEVNNLSYLF